MLAHIVVPVPATVEASPPPDTEAEAEAPQPNQTPPPVSPPPPVVPIPAQPTDEELFRARLFAEPLVPVGGATTPANNAALAAALVAYRAGGGGETLEPLRQFLDNSPGTPWRASLLVNMSVAERRTGHYSRALAYAQEAWVLSKASSEEGPSAVADRALGEVIELLSRLGRVPDLQALLAEVSGRNVQGSATEKVSQGHQARWVMQNRPDVAFRCGPLALERVFAALSPGITLPPAIAGAPSTSQGTSLAQLFGIAQGTGLSLRMAFRPVGGSIVTPSVVHWRSGHFAALVRESGGRYLVQDPTFGDEVWLSRAAIDDEGSGYFLVSGGSLPAGWRSVDPAEGGGIWGKGVPNGQGPGGFGGGGGPPRGGNGAPCPMATYEFQAMLVNLKVDDTPIRYTPAVGPAVAFRVTYNHRESLQPQLPTYGNLSPKWTHDWLSFVTDDPNVVGGTVTVYIRGGGEESYSGYDAGTQLYAGHYMKRAVLKRVSGSPIQYERLLPDGSKEVFAQSDGAIAPRKVFLTQIVDAQGHALTFQYDASLRLTSVTDATGLVTTFAYTFNSLRINRVTDPFGRFTQFTYEAAGDKGALIRITDPIGIQSQFLYSPGNFLRELTTPYGKTRFARGESGRERWLEATDPLGGTERLVYQNEHTTGAPESDPPATVPPGFSNITLNSGLSFFWDKRAMALHPGDFTKAEMLHWLWMPGTNAAVPVLRTSKKPLENRVWYTYPGQASQSYAGTHSSPTKIARVLDDGTTQAYQYEYNAAGKTTKSIDPVGRETVYVYGTGSAPDANPATGTGIDLLQVKQKNPGSPGGYDLLQSTTYNASHQPLTTTDTAGQLTTNTYLADGRIQTTVTPPRNGPNGTPLTVAERTTTYTYYPDNDIASRKKKLQTVTGPLAAQGSPSSSYTYDTVGRLSTTTDQEGYALAFSHDALDRLTRTTYPDGTYDETVYNRLDAQGFRDRLGRWSHTFHDALQRVASTRDAEGRTITYQWCTCGSMDRLLDANGNPTSWERDVQGRVTKETRADNAALEYTYETTTSRLKQRKDPQNQLTTYTYARDNNLTGMAYTNELIATPDVSYTYDPNFNRIVTMQDGTGTTVHGYHPITGPAALGAGKLASIDGPLTADTITYGYDELGRLVTRQINGAANSMTTTYDSLSRAVREVNVLGTFTFAHQGATGRLANVTYPNGQTSTYNYLGNTGDHRLQDIHHQKSGGATLSRQTYTTSPVGQILTWQQQVDSAAPTIYEYGYDRADQLTSAVQKTTGGSPTVLKTFGYAYDAAGNRATESIDTAVVKATYDNRNRLLDHQVGGSVRFAGSLNEPAAVTVAGQPAQVAADNKFAGQAAVTTGINTVPVVATDPAGNVKSQNFQVNVTGAAATFTHDASGNLTSDGVRTFEWDAENRLTAVKQGGTTIASFAYDARGGRRQKIAGGVTRSYVIEGDHVAEERLTGGATGTVRYLHGSQIDDWLGRQETTGATTYFVADHLGSVVRHTDSGGLATLTRAYDAWGAPDATSAAVSGPAYTGREWDAETSQYYYRARSYDPRMGRFLSEDPTGFRAGPNFYAYVENNAVRNVDPAGLFCIPTGRTQSWASMRIKPGSWALVGFEAALFQVSSVAGYCKWARGTTYITFTNTMVEELCTTSSVGCTGAPGVYTRWTLGGRAESQKAGPDQLMLTPAYYINTEYWCLHPFGGMTRVPPTPATR